MALEDYNWLDRMVHKIAFSTSAPQEVLSALEESLYANEIDQKELEEPIFITSLPRAGTTIILEVLANHPSVVTHTYREMPFLFSPIMWRKLSSRFHAESKVKERTHQDGLMVSADSPEAFEEVLWMKHFPKHYTGEGISLWSQIPQDFRTAFERHMKALAVSGDLRGRQTRRYISKNNANIARIRAIADAFPKARFVVPVRNPFDHAQSLLRQHQKALESQASSAFAERYVQDIGHFEFGAAHRPLLFPDMQENAERYDNRTVDYWLAYWLAAFRSLLVFKEVKFLDMHVFTANRDGQKLLTLVGLSSDHDTLQDIQTKVREIPEVNDSQAFDPDLASEALQLYEELKASDNFN